MRGIRQSTFSGRKEFPVIRTLLCLFFTAAALGLLVFCVLPRSAWYHFTLLGVAHSTETRETVFQTYPSDDVFYRVRLGQKSHSNPFPPFFDLSF
jgi:hypothetical protein